MARFPPGVTHTKTILRHEPKIQLRDVQILKTVTVIHLVVIQISQGWTKDPHKVMLDIYIKVAQIICIKLSKKRVGYSSTQPYLIEMLIT